MTASVSRPSRDVIELSNRSRQLATLTARAVASEAARFGTSAPNDSAIPTDAQDGAPRVATADSNTGMASPPRSDRSKERLPNAFDALGKDGESDANKSLFKAPTAERLANVFESTTDDAKLVFTSAADEGRPAASATNGTSATTELSERDKVKLRELQQRDQEVRADELAQTAPGSGSKGPIHLTIERGPDGKEYATNGNVSIDVSAVTNDPQATIIKMWRVQAAALASGGATGVDQQVDALAATRLAEALQEMAKARFAVMQGSRTDGAATPGLSLTA